MKRKSIIILILALFTAALLTPAASAANVLFIDSLEDMSKLHDFAFDVSLPENANDPQFFEISAGTKLGDDQTLMIHGACLWIVENNFYPYLTWEVAGGAKVEFMAYLWNDGISDFRLSWSADGENYTDVKPSSVEKISTENAAKFGVADEYDMTGGYEQWGIFARLYTVNAINANAKYFRVTWPESGQTATYEAAPTMYRVSEAAATGGGGGSGSPKTGDDYALFTGIAVFAFAATGFALLKRSKASQVF